MRSKFHQSLSVVESTRRSQQSSRFARRLSFYTVFITAFVIGALAATLFGLRTVRAQEAGAVQELIGTLEPRTGDYYILHDLEQGQKLSVYAKTISGNLDPFVGIRATEMDGETLLAALRESYDRILAEGLDPTIAVRDVVDQFFVAWNDDGNTGSAASLTFNVPSDGDYRLLIMGSPGQLTFGGYRMQVGVDAPEVTTGQARDTGDVIATLDTKIPPIIVAADEITGVFTEDKRMTQAKLRNLSAGDTVYAYVEAMSGDLSPTLSLENYRGKPLIIDNHTGEASSASLQYTVPQDTGDLRVRIVACCGDEPAGGEYRLLVGVNAPDVLSGKAEVTDMPALVSPSTVQIGVKLDQITGVDQVSENFGAVVDVRLEWDEPGLAFDPDSCGCGFLTFTPSAFQNHLDAVGVEAWPISTLYNQQGRRDEQGNTIVVDSEGHVIYVSRFTATLQAPDFNFRLFPFDRQTFHIRLRAVFPEEFFVYIDLEKFTNIGEQLGEEEWMITDWGTSVDTSDNRSRFNFTFSAVRHLDYYLYRIFLPLLIIILVSWAIFFLRDYGKRVDAAAGNLLLLIAFNFTISGNLPRLGYLTLMDIVLITTFVVTGMVLVLNVYLKRMEVDGRRDRAARIDKYVLWLYPFVYVVMIGGIGLLFFVSRV